VKNGGRDSVQKGAERSDASGQDAVRMLKQEVKLHINNRLYETGMISKEVYEEAKVRIVSSRIG